jgi:hypothetical protein
VRPGNKGSRNKTAKREVKKGRMIVKGKGGRRGLERIKIISAISQILTAEGKSDTGGMSG